MKTHFFVLLCCAILPCLAQTEAPRKPSDGPYTPKLIMPGGLMLPLYAPDSPMLKKERIHEEEIYNSTSGGKGPINSVINIHNPSIEVHLVPKGQANTGTVVIVVPGGGHKILWVGPEGADYVPFFAKAGVSTIILRNRLRADGYEPTVDAVNDAFQAIRLVRSHAAEWAIDPAKIGIIGFSAGAELSAPAALFFDQYEKNHQQASDPLAVISARPDFVGVIYPGPTPFTKAPDTVIPATVPPSFIACAGSGDQVHAVWATEYFSPMLKASVPNLEMHIYGRGGHGVSGKDRETIPYGAWRERFMDWLRDLEFLGAPGVETKAARDVAKYAALPPANLRKDKN
jgi:endo-1,4-beta-xylanase